MECGGLWLWKLVPAALAVVIAAEVSANQPGLVLHEFLAGGIEQDLVHLGESSANTEPGRTGTTPLTAPPDPHQQQAQRPSQRSDTNLSQTALSGAQPPAASGPSDGADRGPRQPLEDRQHRSDAYRGSDVYTADRDTRRPVVSTYDDPFSPSISPYKRLRAYDAVRGDFRLTVATSRLSWVELSGAPSAGEDVFTGDLRVGFEGGEVVGIPTVGPGVRLVDFSVDVAGEGFAGTRPMVTLFRDGADNWYAQGPGGMELRLRVRLAVDRGVFGGGFDDATWTLGVDAASGLVPANVAAAIKQVRTALGLAKPMPRREAVAKMVAYFREFRASAETPQATDNVYLDLALSKKGVCRHRAYAFVVTALGMGIPSRMVVNESHAWVEVEDARVWRRIDLGGASTRLEPEARAGSENERESVPRHEPGADPFPWPSSSERDHGTGNDSALAVMQMTQGPGASEEAGVRDAETGRSAALEQAQASEEPERGIWATIMDFVRERQMDRAPARLEIERVDRRVLRGDPMRIEGRVDSAVGACSRVKVEVVLVDRSRGTKHWVGALSTDGDGRFAGTLVVPLEVEVGEYDVEATTPGNDVCTTERITR